MVTDIFLHKNVHQQQVPFIFDAVKFVEIATLSLSSQYTCEWYGTNDEFFEHDINDEQQR